MVYMRGVVLFLAGLLVGTIIMKPISAQENKVMGLRINHVGIGVTNMQQTVDFYTKVMGFRVAYNIGPNGVGGSNFVQVSRDTFIEVAQAGPNAPARITHIGLGTENLNGTVTQLRQNGANPPDARVGGPSGSLLSSIMDPNGIRLELNEQPAGSLMRKAIESWK
jgi:catechol 2,3-dioxygenase-like lactoylglutathione lyase family enzyme